MYIYISNYTIAIYVYIFTYILHVCAYIRIYICMHYMIYQIYDIKIFSFIVRYLLGILQLVHWMSAFGNIRIWKNPQDIVTVDAFQLRRVSHGGGDGKSPLIPRVFQPFTNSHYYNWISPSCSDQQNISLYWIF